MRAKHCSLEEILLGEVVLGLSDGAFDGASDEAFDGTNGGGNDWIVNEKG